MDVKKALRATLKELAKDCGYDEFVVLGGKKWTIGMMSYDEMFLEPFRKGRTERDDFDKNTLWEKSDGIEILQLLVGEQYFTLTKNLPT